METQVVKCFKCGETDPGKFAVCNARKTGLQVYCKKCHGKMVRASRDKLKRIPWNWKARYQITADQYDMLFAQQNKVCAICGKPESATMRGKTIRLAVDHDHACCPGKHSCGKCIRGLLCRHCNYTLARWKDNLGMFEKAVDYLKNSKTISQRVL